MYCSRLAVMGRAFQVQWLLTFYQNIPYSLFTSLVFRTLLFKIAQVGTVIPVIPNFFPGEEIIFLDLNKLIKISLWEIEIAGSNHVLDIVITIVEL